MENNAKNSNLVKVVLAEAEIGLLINLAGLNLNKTSPLFSVIGKTGPSDSRRLQQSGLLDSNGRPASECLEALTILANPDTELSLLWGNAGGISLTKVYFSARSGKLVSFTRANGNCNLSYFLSHQDITDLIADKIAFQTIKEPADISLETGTAALPAFLSVLDLYRESQLRAALERRQEAEVIATTIELNRIWQDSKMESNFSWYAPAGHILTVDNPPVSSAVTEQGFNALKKSALIESNGALSSKVLSFASAAFPLMAFFGVKAFFKQGAQAEKVDLALFRGFSTLLFVQTTSNGGKEQLSLKSISTSQLPEVLFNLVTKPFDVQVQPEKPDLPVQSAPVNNLACGKCGVSNPSGAKFCSKCGATLAAAAPIKFCPKCGDPVTSVEKFCDKCGTKLV